MQHYTALNTPIGSVCIVATPGRLSHVYLTSRPREAALEWLGQRHAGARHDPDLLEDLQYQIGLYFAGERVSFQVPVDLTSLTEFQRRVLRACARIGYGRTTTYGELARRLGAPEAARAVGGALARNPVPLVIPCHRVLACNGKLGGFSAEQGLGLKKYLLDLEAEVRASI
ncbi:MAG: methylated-DNA--protein-cysteine methyltransferase [Phycisphaerae bacterium]